MTKEIALTFDDGPWGTRTVRVLDELTNRKIPATFMIWGVHMAEYPEILKVAGTFRFRESYLSSSSFDRLIR